MHMPTLKRVWTARDLDDLPDDGNRYEVIDGELFVTPAPAWRHQDAVVEMHRVLADYLGAQRVGHAIIAPADVVFSPKRAVRPDLFVVPLVEGRRPERFEDVGRLLLAVEVLAERLTWRAEGVASALEIDLADYFSRVLDA
jgi:Uma2 family endonuclease